jgi:hypothetical protein
MGRLADVHELDDLDVAQRGCALHQRLDQSVRRSSQTAQKNPISGRYAVECFGWADWNQASGISEFCHYCSSLTTLQRDNPAAGVRCSAPLLMSTHRKEPQNFYYASVDLGSGHCQQALGTQEMYPWPNDLAMERAECPEGMPARSHRWRRLVDAPRCGGAW